MHEIAMMKVSGLFVFGVLGIWVAIIAGVICDKESSMLDIWLARLTFMAFGISFIFGCIILFDIYVSNDGFIKFPLFFEWIYIVLHKYVAYPTIIFMNMVSLFMLWMLFSSVRMKM